jgi:uncharacterized protein with HEPN domain
VALRILNAIKEIESFFNDSTKEFLKYQNDLWSKRAIERNIEIIGEALSRILKRDETILILNSRKIVDTTNRIIHGYDFVSDDVIWGIIIRHLPILQAEIQNIIGRVEKHYTQKWFLASTACNCSNFFGQLKNLIPNVS